MQDWLLSFAKSRKFWLAVLGVAVPWLNKKLGMDMTPEQVLAAMGTIATLIGAISIEDHARHTAGAAKAKEIAAAIAAAAKPPGAP